MDLFYPIWTHLDKFEKILFYFEQFGAVWTNLDGIGPIEGVIFSVSERFHDFFVPRGCVIFSSSERLRDFFCPKRLRDFVVPAFLSPA